MEAGEFKEFMFKFLLEIKFKKLKFKKEQIQFGMSNFHLKL